jgi:hypothetical protein
MTIFIGADRASQAQASQKGWTRAKLRCRVVTDLVLSFACDMTDFAIRFLSALVAFLQVVGACGFAPGSYYCEHPDGSVQLESAAASAACHQEDLVPESAPIRLDAKECSDVPVGTQAPLERSRTRTSDQLSIPALVIVPAIVSLPQRIYAPPQRPEFLRAARLIPNTEHLSLGSIILLI